MTARHLTDWAKAELADLPVVSFRVVALTVLDYFSFGLVVGIALWKDTSDGVPVLNAWLFFLAALHGANLGSFATAVKSESTTPGGQQMIEKKVDVVAANTGTFAVPAATPVSFPPPRPL